MAAGAQYGSRNVLSDADIRDGVKEFTKWPTIPQVRDAPYPISLKHWNSTAVSCSESMVCQQCVSMKAALGPAHPMVLQVLFAHC